MIRHRCRLQAPDAAWILKMADQLLLLGVDADDGQGLPGKSPSLLFDALKLAVPFRMRLGKGLEVGVQAIAQLAEESTNRAGADVDVPPFEFLGDLPQAFVRPHSATSHGVASRVVFEQTGQNLQEFGRFFSTLGRPDPERRTR